MRIRRALHATSSFFTQILAALLKAVVTSAVLGVFAVAVMHYMGVQVPNPYDLLRGVSKLADILS